MLLPLYKQSHLTVYDRSDRQKPDLLPRLHSPLNRGRPFDKLGVTRDSGRPPVQDHCACGTSVRTNSHHPPPHSVFTLDLLQRSKFTTLFEE